MILWFGVLFGLSIVLLSIREILISHSKDFVYGLSIIIFSLYTLMLLFITLHKENKK